MKEPWHRGKGTGAEDVGIDAFSEQTHISKIWGWGVGGVKGAERERGWRQRRVQTLLMKFCDLEGVTSRNLSKIIV